MSTQSMSASVNQGSGPITKLSPVPQRTPAFLFWVLISPINGSVNGILPLGACGSAIMSRCTNALTSFNPVTIGFNPPAVP